jgi:hypothetical protein
MTQTHAHKSLESQKAPKTPQASPLRTAAPELPAYHVKILTLQRTIGNRAVCNLINRESAASGPRPEPGHFRPTPFLQTKLTVNRPGDRYEQEADRVAERVMRMTIPAKADTQTPQLQRACPRCPKEEEKIVRRQAESGGTPNVTPELESRLQSLRGGGQPLPPSVRNFFEPRFGQDFSQVRIYTDIKAANLATTLQAIAFTRGRHIVFNRGIFSPNTSTGKRILAHELTHVVQQRGSTQDQSVLTQRNSSISVQQSTAMPIIARLSASDCARDCAKEDGKGVATGLFSITIYADNEGPFLLLPATHKVGHSWLRLEDDIGRYWTYGFWPQEGYDPSNIQADVEGCVHHPDTSHKPTASQRFELTAAQFSAAFTAAVDTCSNLPKYNLFGLQCTEFVKQVLATAGQGSFGGFGLIWESPNALDSWIRTHSLVLGTSVTAATSASGDAGVGSFGLDLTYRNQFYSLLGQELRLYGLGRAEISGPVKSLAAGAGLELNPQKVWLPAPFIEGGSILGDLSPVPEQSRFGAGVTGAAGLRYNIDQLGVVGIEYNVVKDIVNADPALHRLMLTAGIRLF